MGHQDQFAKRTFAEQTELVTQGAILWRDPPELQLVKAQLDGQMPGDHLDLPVFERAVLRSMDAPGV